MSSTEALQLFEDQPIRTAWDAEAEEWYFSIVDVVGVLTESSNPNNYWKVLKKRLLDEGNELVTNCNQLKLKSPKDGKRYKTDVASTEQLLWIIQPVFNLLHQVHFSSFPSSVLESDRGHRPQCGLRWIRFCRQET